MTLPFQYFWHLICKELQMKSWNFATSPCCSLDTVRSRRAGGKRKSWGVGHRGVFPTERNFQLDFGWPEVCKRFGIWAIQIRRLQTTTTAATATPVTFLRGLPCCQHSDSFIHSCMNIYWALTMHQVLCVSLDDQDTTTTKKPKWSKDKDASPHEDDVLAEVGGCQTRKHEHHK